MLLSDLLGGKCSERSFTTQTFIFMAYCEHMSKDFSDGMKPRGAAGAIQRCSVSLVNFISRPSVASPDSLSPFVNSLMFPL